MVAREAGSTPDGNGLLVDMSTRIMPNANVSSAASPTAKDNQTQNHRVRHECMSQ